MSDVVVPWPLHLLGGGLSHEDTVLAAPRGADAALDFRWAPGWGPDVAHGCRALPGWGDRVRGEGL